MPTAGASSALLLSLFVFLAQTSPQPHLDIHRRRHLLSRLPASSQPAATCISCGRHAWPLDDDFVRDMSSSGSATSTMRPTHHLERKFDEMKPTKTDINWVIMDYLVSEGYPGAAEKFAQETNICTPADLEGIRERVRIRNAIHAGKIDEAIEKINELDPEILDTDHLLHFNLLQLQLIEIIRGVLTKPGGNPQSGDFRPALEFATEQLSPRAPTAIKYQSALERTMALMIFPPDKMPADFKELLDLKLREKVADSVNKAILESKGQRSEAKIRQLVRARAWAEAQAKEAKIDMPAFLMPIGLDGPGKAQQQPDAMVT